MSTLVVKHLPSVLSDDSIKEFFQHYGAADVKIMQGKMKGSVFVTCKDNEEAKKLILQLHDLKFLDRTLAAEIVKDKGDTEESTPKSDATPAKPEEAAAATTSEKAQFEPIAPSLGVNYPSNPYLEYRYPAPNPLILTNIVNAMTSRPKFYTQVLHLMNKMNLPPPFGPPAPVMPLLPEAVKRKREEEEEEESESDDDLDTEPSSKRAAPSSLSSATPSSSSTLSSTAPSGAALAQQLIQQQQQQLTQQLLNQQKQQHQQQEQQQQQQKQLEQLQQHLQQQQQQSQQLQQQAQSMALNPATAFSTPLNINIPIVPSAGGVIPALPSASSSKKPAAAGKEKEGSTLPFLLPSQQQQQQQLQLQQQQQQIQITQQQIQQQEQLLQQQQQFLQQLAPSLPASKYISSEELAANKVSLDEIKQIDKKYEKGETSVKLYIKNLAWKQVEISDLERIFGKYFPSEQAMKDGLDIKLMKEGRMKGQAFVTFQDEELAEEALEEINGYKLYDKPMIIQYGKVGVK